MHSALRNFTCEERLDFTKAERLFRGRAEISWARTSSTTPACKHFFDALIDARVELGPVAVKENAIGRERFVPTPFELRKMVCRSAGKLPPRESIADDSFGRSFRRPGRIEAAQASEQFLAGRALEFLTQLRIGALGSGARSVRQRFDVKAAATGNDRWFSAGMNFANDLLRRARDIFPRSSLR